MGDERLIALVDANLAAFAEHLAGGDRPATEPRSNLSAAAAAFFGRRGQGYGLWTRAHADAALEAVLPSAGFRLELDLPVMVLETRPAVVPAPAGAELRRVVDEAGVADFRAAERAALADDGAARAAVESAFADPASLLDPAAAGFVAYVAGVPAAAAMSFTALDVARIGWVGTAPAFRRRGLGSAVTRAAVLAGYDRGASLAALESSPAAVPLYEALGFRRITSYRVWSIG